MPIPIRKLCRVRFSVPVNVGVPGIPTVPKSETPKAFANCSPGLERSDNPGIDNPHPCETLKRVRQPPNPFRVKGKSYNRHARAKTVGVQTLAQWLVSPVEQKLADEVYAEPGKQLCGPALERVFVIVAVRIPRLARDDCARIDANESRCRDYEVPASRSRRDVLE